MCPIVNFVTSAVSLLFNMIVDIIDCDFETSCWIGTTNYYQIEGLFLLEDAENEIMNAINQVVMFFYPAEIFEELEWVFYVA